MRPLSSTKRKNNLLELEINDRYSKMNHQRCNLEIKKDDFYQDILKGEIKNLIKLWDELGVTDEYKDNFIENILKINALERNNILEKEKITLTKLNNSLINLKKEIISREKNINSLHKYNNIIENYIIEGNTINIHSNKFQEICNVIIGLRYNAINIVNQISNINKIIFTHKQKWNLKKIKEKFLYDPKYLNKMKEDLKFLKNSILSKFIEMNNSEIDAFLTNFVPGTGIINNKLNIPLTEELMKAINNSRYLLLHESVLISNLEINKKNNFSELYLNTESDYKANQLDFINQNQKNQNIINFFTPRIQRSIKKLKNSESSNFNNNISRELYHHKKNLGTKNYNELFYKNNPIYRSITKKRKKLKIRDNIDNKYTLFNNNKTSRILIERDEMALKSQMPNVLSDEKNKNKILNKEILLLKKENTEYKIKYNELKKLYDNLNNKTNYEEEKRINAEKDVDILQIKIKQLNEKNDELLKKLAHTKKVEKNNNDIYESNKIKELEKKLKDEDTNKKSEEEIKKLLKIIENKNEEILKLKKEIENLKAKKPDDNYKIEFYKGNIMKLVNSLREQIHYQNLPDFLKKVFLLDESIYTDEYYFKGIFPKIIICKNMERDNLNGICSLSYENNENLNENLNLKINCIFTNQNVENSIILMINYIKENMNFDKLVVYLLYDKIGNKFLPNKEAKEIFQKKLGFKWLCVVRNEEKNQRYIKLYYNKNEAKNIENQNNFNKNNFHLDNYTLITMNNEENTNSLKNKRKEEVEKDIKTNYNKYINKNAIYSLLNENPNLKIDFSNDKLKKELNEMKGKLWKFNINIYNWISLEEKEKKDIKNINTENSLFKEVENYYNKSNIKILSYLQKRNISINFETTYSILIDNIYYNRISSDKIKILKENKTNSIFFLIPSINNTVFLYISEINQQLKELLIDNENNIYEQFLEFQPSTQKELYNFSIQSIRDISYIPQALKTEQKVIYIPTFIIKNHLYSYDLNEFNNIRINNKESNEQLYLNSVDEYINIEFRPDYNIKNSFSILPIEDKNKNIIIKDSFIIGIFVNDIINNDKLPLMQFLYVTKDKFLTKDNFKEFLI